MGVGQENVAAIGATQIALAVLGASVFPTKVIAPNGCCGMDVMYVSGSSIQILPNAISGFNIAQCAVGNSFLGFPISTTPYVINGPASFYLASVGASPAIAAINFRFTSSGASNMLA